jgi:hypothetical protein
MAITTMHMVGVLTYPKKSKDQIDKYLELAVVKPSLKIK